MKKEKKKPPQRLVWFRLNGLGSSQNAQNNLIHNWYIGACWVRATQQPGVCHKEKSFLISNHLEIASTPDLQEF
jgi:hypothetical protein